MAKSSALSSFVKWAGGIAASVITAVLIFWLTRPPHPPQPTPKPASLVVAGRVFDLSSNKLLPGVNVTLSAGSYSGHQSTDSEGRYGFSVDGVDPSSIATLTIVASGYAPDPYIAEQTLVQMSDSDGDEPLNSATPPAAPTAGPGAAPQAPTNLRIPVKAERTLLANLRAKATAGQPQGPSSQPAKELPPYMRRTDLLKIGTLARN